MVRIAEVLPGTVAAELRLEIGSRIVRINGAPVRDAIDLRFLETEERVDLEVAPGCGGETTVYEIEKDAGEPLGVVPAPDAIRECANKCVFCFIDGNPRHARPSLWLRDDDFRLSFTYGSYVTLTNLGPRGFQRLIDQRLSPLYVSVHATEPRVRMRLLGVRRGGEIVEQLAALAGAGIDVHTQVVLCPGWNDGEHLDRTIADLYAIGPRVLSLSVVPVGLTKYNLNRPVRLLTPDEATAAIAQVDAVRQRATRERGTGWAYVADEMYFVAGRALPGACYYDDWPLTENGVGAVRSLLDAFDAGLDGLSLPPGLRAGVVTGSRMAAVLRPLVARAADRTGARVEVLEVGNDWFGPTVTTAGLLPGGSIVGALAARSGEFDAILLPTEALNDDGVFVDDVPLDEVAAAASPAQVVTGHELIAALSSL